MEDHQIQLDSIEAYLRRASELDMPFMVKGSIITRQYFPKPEMRYVADLDFVYLKFIDKDEDAGKLFSSWVTKVTETNLNDGVNFRSFKENDFWRRIDYAMNDDFPTVDTDLLCWVDGQLNDRLSLDISYNLDIDFPPIEILYKPRIGKPFMLRNACPFPLQVSWKLHQLLTRPRVKDIYDLIYLINHRDFDPTSLDQSLYALKKECVKDDIDIKRLKWYIDGTMEEYHKLEEEKKATTERFKHLDNKIYELRDLDLIAINHYKWFTDQEFFKYKELSELFHEFSVILRENGVNEDKINSI